MSGVAGLFRFDNAPIEPALIEEMTESMSYRGPQGLRHWREHNVALGHCSLETTTESVGEIQPVANEDQTLVLSMDGRVDNYLELRRDLRARGVVLRTQTDSELVLRAYELWQEKCVERIDGDFAIVVWDARRKRVFCARDRAGHKPLHYCVGSWGLAVASDLRALFCCPWIKKNFDEDYVAECLAATCVSRAKTLWQGISRLVASSYLIFSSDLAPVVRRYWQPDMHAEIRCKNDDEYAEGYLALLTDCVRRASRSNLPVAYEVSGGLDSSSIYALAVDLLNKKIIETPKIQGYTLDFSGKQEADELSYVRSVEKHTRTKIEEIEPLLSPLHWYRATALECCDLPDFPNGAMHASILESARKHRSRVLVGGVGGDEWLWGNRSYYADLIKARQWRSFSSALKADISAVGTRRAVRDALRYGVFLCLPSPVQAQLISLRRSLRMPSGGRRYWWLAPALRARFRECQLQLSKAPSPTFARAEQAELWDLWTMPYGQLARELNERRAARHGFEIRQPFWDARMVQWAFSTPTYLRMRGSTAKWIHRHALRDILPQDVVSRRDKAEFSVVFEHYKTQMQAWIEEHHKTDADPWMTPQAMRALANEPQRFTGDAWVAGIPWMYLALSSLRDAQSASPLK
ncbi:MAG: asparagine synthase (glutamine-hydrolyzing) [Casimicrobium sp.]